MEIGKDQHHEAFMCNVHEDFRDDDEDEDENRFIISLDDIEVKEDSLDECDNCHKEQEDTRTGHIISDTCDQYHKATLSIKGQNVVNTEVSREDASGKANSLKFQSQEEQVGETMVPSIIIQNSGNTDFVEVNNLKSIRSRKMCSVPDNKVLDADNKECKESSNNKSKHDMIKQSISADICTELSSDQNINGVQHEIDSGVGKEPISVNHRTVMKFVPHQNCSCIMCYQGRGIIDTNWIPKAAKRKMDMSVSQVSSKAMKQIPVKTGRHANKFSETQIDCGKNSSVSSKRVHVPSMLVPVCIDSSSTGSHDVRSQLFEDVSVLPSNLLTAREPHNNSSNNFVPLKGKYVSSCQSTLTGGKASTPLPILTPKPPSLHSSTSTLTNTPLIASNLSSQVNVTLPANSLPLTTSSNAQMHPLASDKTHVVLINKSTVERQLTDLNCILQMATKVDLSKPGMALVHFRLPASISNSSQVSLQTSPQTSNVQSSEPALCKSTGDTLYGLVKHHLIDPSVSSSTASSSPNQTINSNISQQCSQSQTFPQTSLSGVPKRPNLLSKPHYPYSLIKRMNISGSPSILPPPPPLQPRPSSNNIGAPRSSNQNSNVVDVEKHQTETIVLPLPKSERNEKSSSQAISVGKSKQDKLLSSPGLFTFSSPLELSSQKVVMPLRDGLSEDLSKLNKTTQYQQSFQNWVSSSGPLFLSSSMSSSLCKPGIIIKCSSVTSSTCTDPMTTMSSTMNQQSTLHFSSTPSSMPQADSGTPCALLLQNHNNHIPITSRHQQQFLSDIASVENSSIYLSSQKGNPSWQSDPGMINIPSSPTPLLCSTPSTPSQSSVSIVSNVNGLKMKIRFKDKKSEETKVLSTGTEEIPSIHPAKSSHNISEVRILSSDMHPQDGSKECCVSYASEISTSAIVSVSNSSMEMGKPAKVTGPVETAEEMFKRFEDQAMQQVYNAQFGVGEIQRNLRPNRTPVAASDHVYSYAKVKTNPGEPTGGNQSGVGFQKKRAVKSKRSGSGDSRQMMPDEKRKKIDINQYPKLIQDNSILNRKTVFTPNILAGHKVYVKFNVFSNSQSGRSFLAPFFNIGGSRTQFDVEDMEYINKAVIEFEKEEKSCARHLLFYSREGNKAVFLRKESGLHSNELSPKVYKKHSYILEGYTRERSKQTYQLSEKWKVDNKVQIEIDRAEQDSEIDLQNGHTKDELKKSDKTKAELTACASSDASPSISDSMSNAVQKNSFPLPSPIYDFQKRQKIGPQEACKSTVDPRKAATKSTPKAQTYSHRDFVNILKKRDRFPKKVTNDSALLSSEKTSSSLPERHNSDCTEHSKEPSTTGNRKINISLSASSSSFDLHRESSGFKHDSLKDNLKDCTRENIPESVIHIKTEIPDNGYEAALHFRGNKITSTPEISRLTIKSEPIDDYTESLARSMNVSLKKDHANGTESPTVCENNIYGSKKLEDLCVIKSSKADNVSKINIDIQPKTFPNPSESLSATRREADPSLCPTNDVSNSCRNMSVDKIPTAESESMQISSNPDASLIPESSKVASSSEIESSSEEEESDEDAFPLISSSSTSESTNASYVLNTANTNTPAASRKINSLVESLAQRLTQNSLILPPLFPTSAPKKKRKRKEKKFLQKHPDSKENSLPSTPDLVKHVTSVQSFAANVSQNMSLNSTVVSSKTITVTACRNNTSTSRVDMRPFLTTSLSSSNLSPRLSPPFVSFTDENSFRKLSGEPSKISTLSLNSNGNRDQNKSEGFAMSYNDVNELNNQGESLSYSLTNGVKGTSQLTEKDFKSNESFCSVEPKLEGKDFACERMCKLGGIVDDTEMMGKEQLTDIFSMETQLNDETEVVDILSQHGEGNLMSNQDNEIKMLTSPKPGSNCSSPCSEIDVGVEQVSVEIPVKRNSVPVSSLLTSPPVPFKGKVCIKDFTREHDLMVPFETRTEPEPNTNTKINVKASKPPSTDLSLQRNEKIKNKASQAKSSEEIKILGNPTQADSKPSIASLLCEKLAIEVGPLIPKTKSIKSSTSTVYTNSTQAFDIQQKPVTSVGKTSFYKPTLSAIFGVDDMSLPCPKKRKEEKKSTSVELTGKRRQVAVKGIHNPRRCKTSQKLSPLKIKKLCKKEERQKGKNTNPHISLRQQKFGIQSFFRTWRQLSHEERKRKEVKETTSQQFCTIPCKVIVERLEDMQFRADGQSVKAECDNQILAFENNKEKEHRSLNVKRRRKRTSVKVQRRRQPKEKKDIVDYYASVLENLRKKAQMLEEEDLEKKESKTEKEKNEPEGVIKIEPITFHDEPGILMLSEEDSRKDTNLLRGGSTRTEFKFKGENCTQYRAISKCELIQDAVSNINAEDSVVGEEKSVSVINAMSQSQDLVKDGSMFKTLIDLKSQSSNHTDTAGNVSKCLERDGKEDSSGDTDNQTKMISDDLENNVSLSAVTDVKKEDLKNQGSPTDVTLSATKNSFLSLSSFSEDCILRSEQSVKKCPERVSSEDKIKPDLETRQIADSSFKTKDIVLGFENEVGIDTDFSATSQGDMEDMFLLEDGEEDSSMDMIPPEEVEKLLGLDLTNEGGLDNGSSKQQKAESLKSSFVSSPGCSDSKLQWVPLLETKEKSRTSKDMIDEKEEELSSEEIVSDNQDALTGSPKHRREESACDGLNVEYPLQPQQKKHQISPSWNRLLGLEALRKMEKSVPTSSQPIVDLQNNFLPSADQLRVKFDLGAFSKALKLSAEMKRVFAEGHSSKDASDQPSAYVKRHRANQQENVSYECPSRLVETETSDVDCSSALSDAVKDYQLNGKEMGNMKLIRNAPVGIERDMKMINKEKSIIHMAEATASKCITITGTLNEGLQRETRRKARSKCSQHISKQNILEKASDPIQTDSDVCKTNITSVSSNSDTFTPISKDLQSFSADESLTELRVKTRDAQSSSAVPNLQVRGIDLNKLKLKLNPLFYTNKKRTQSTASNGKHYSLSSQLCNDKSKDKEVVTLVPSNCPRISVPDDHLESEQYSAKTKGDGCSPRANVISDEFSKSKSSNSNKNSLGKQWTEAEPLLNTVKLCNILKNVTRPNSLPKSLKSLPSNKTSSYQGHSSMKSKTSRTLRSSSRSLSLKSSKDLSNCEMVVHSIPLKNEQQNDEMKRMEEDKTERSFFDCLPSVISGVWDK